MRIENVKTDTLKLKLILSEKELEYLKFEIGEHKVPDNTALYSHFFGYDLCSIIDIEMIPFIMTEIEFLYQDKITLCKLYELLKRELLNNKSLREHYLEVN